MRTKLGSLVRGLYFIRFSLAMWLVPIVLLLLDAFSSFASITRAILTPEHGRQALSAAFMLFSNGMVVLLTVRLVALNGHERFQCELEEDNWLVRLWGTPELPLWLFILAHLPGAAMLAYLVFNMHRERVQDLPAALSMMTLGLVIGLVFWLLIGAFYWWTFDPEAHPGNPPRPLLFPRKVLFLLTDQAITDIQQSPPPPLMHWLNSLFFSRLANYAGRGFTESANNRIQLYEGHSLAILGLLGLLLMYLYLFAFTSPVPLPAYNFLCNLVCSAALVFIFAGVFSGARPTKKAPRVVKFLISLLLLGAVLFAAASWILNLHAPRGFSVLASVLVLTIGFFWLLTGVAFLCDASRFPVLTGVVLLLFVFKWIPIYRTEHYFSAIYNHDVTAAAVPLPASILAKRLPDPKHSRQLTPLIVITAEGGGIHSAAWTAAVLMELESQFAQHQPAYSFDGNILLASGVSGGSVGLLPFLREYRPDGSFDHSQQASDRVTTAAACSSLQAVAWGLTYYDALNFLSPIPLMHPSGVQWTTASATAKPEPEGLDRSWALERAIARNLTDGSCFLDKSRSTSSQAADSGYELTLADAAKRLAAGHLPAFTFNTTAVETGDRFLLANYELPTGQDHTDVLPAESFLQAYSQEDPSEQIDHEEKVRLGFADLPLTTAARLSASFPYISSASRIPQAVDKFGEHFVDGGYFDNDGTSSAVEFLHYALGAVPDSSPWPYDDKLPILLIEIRNDWDLSAGDNRDSFEHQENLVYQQKNSKDPVSHWAPADPKKGDPKDPPNWGPFRQVVAPPKAFWAAGHESDTRRNRRELCMLEKAYETRLRVHHMVFDYRDKEQLQEPQPLSWELTARQQADIRCAIDPKPCSDHKDSATDQEAFQYAYKGGAVTIRELANSAASWFSDHDQQQRDDTCEAFGRDKPDSNPRH